MSKSDYFSKLKDPRWQRRRLEVMQRAGFFCEACGEASETLSVHHGYYRFGVEPWDADESTLWCLCESCHQEAQDVLADIKIEIGRVNPAIYRQVLFAILGEQITGQCTRERLPG